MEINLSYDQLKTEYSMPMSVLSAGVNLNVPKLDNQGILLLIVDIDRIRGLMNICGLLDSGCPKSYL